LFTKKAPVLSGIGGFGEGERFVSAAARPIALPGDPFEAVKGCAAKHELGWADFQVRSEQAIVRH
jgi:hypothetical protein